MMLAGNRAAGLRYFEEAVRAGERLPSSVFYGRGLAKLGHVLAGDIARREEGLGMLAGAAEAQARIDDKYGLSLTENLRCDLLLSGGRYPEALQAAQSFLQLTRDLATAEDFSVAVVNVALARIELGHYARRPRGSRCSRGPSSAAWSGQSTARCAPRCRHGRGCGGPRAWPRPRRLRGRCRTVQAIALPHLLEGWLALGQGEAARALVADLEAVLGAGKDEHGQLAWALGQALERAAAGDWAAAAEAAGRAYELAEHVEGRGVQVKALRLQAEAALRAASAAHARAVERGQAMAEQRGDDAAAGALRGAHGRIGAGRGRGRCDGAFRRCRRWRTRWGRPCRARGRCTARRG